MARDDNNVPILQGTLQSDGETVVAIRATPSSGIVDSSNASTGTNSAGQIAKRTGNYTPVILAISADDDDVLVPVAVDANGAILIDSN